MHSHYVERNVRALGYEGRLWRIPHPAWRRPATAPASIEGGPIIGCFGHLTASKRIPQLIQAFQVLRRLHPEARLLVVGAATPGFSLEARLRESDLVGVVREDYVDEERLWALMSACDVVVSLRTPTMGETSGSAIRALVAARPLVVSDVGWFSELPDEVALKIPVDSLEIATLTTALELLASSEQARSEMSASARAYVRSEHALDRVAHAYAAALEEVAVGETVRAPAVARSRVPLGVSARCTPPSTAPTTCAGSIGSRCDESPNQRPSQRRLGGWKTERCRVRVSCAMSLRATSSWACGHSTTGSRSDRGRGGWTSVREDSGPLRHATSVRSRFRGHSPATAASPTCSTSVTP